MTKILNNIPDNLEEKLFEEYAEVKRHFQLNEHGPGELNGGRFAEVVLRIFQHLLGEAITPLGKNIGAAQKTSIISRVTNHPNVDEHIRQKVTVLVKLLLDFRNNRDVAHLGGFSADEIDSSFVLSCTNWIVAEFIRVYGTYPRNQAQKAIDKIAVPNYPVIFDIEGEDFITRDDLSAKQEVLILLCQQKRTFDFIFSKTRDKNSTRFKQTIESMRKEKLIEFKDGFYHIMPNGLEEIRKKNLLNYT
jgi:hypothetical protein